MFCLECYVYTGDMIEVVGRWEPSAARGELCFSRGLVRVRVWDLVHCPSASGGCRSRRPSRGVTTDRMMEIAPVRAATNQRAESRLRALSLSPTSLVSSRVAAGPGEVACQVVGASPQPVVSPKPNYSQTAHRLNLPPASGLATSSGDAVGLSPASCRRRPS